MRWIAPLLLLLGACAGVEAAPEWAGTEEILPNGAVRVSNPAQGLWTEETAWRLVPELVIGELDGGPEYTFAAIIDVEADDDGRIYVLDRQANQLRIFDRDGAHLRTVGREGSGPGEYRNANGLGWLSPDSLVVVDQPGGRYSVLSREGDFVRSVPRNLGFYGWGYRGGIADGRVYEEFSVDCETKCLPVLLKMDLRPDEHASVDTLYLPVPPGPDPEVLVATYDRGQRFMRFPFSGILTYHVGDAGDILAAHGSAFRIVHTRLAGDTIREIELQSEPAPVTQAEIDEWAESESVRSFREVGGMVDLGRVPRVKPHLDGLHLDPEGFYWVSVPAAPTETVFAVFDPEGRYLGRIRIEGLVRSFWMPLRVRNDHLYLVGRDELEVQRVHVFRIEKGSGG